MVVTSRAKRAALLKRLFQPQTYRIPLMRHKPRETRGPIETHRPSPGRYRTACGHKPRETRGPIETCRYRLDNTMGTAVTSRAKRAALLKRTVVIVDAVVGRGRHKPRETRSPIETRESIG